MIASLATRLPRQAGEREPVPEQPRQVVMVIVGGNFAKPAPRA